MWTEELLPKEILNLSLRSGNEFGWRFEDMPKVVAAAKASNLGILGGQVQYITNDGTCELYWLAADPEERLRGESWQDYVERSALDFLRLFEVNINSKDVREDALNSFDHLKQKQKQGVDIEQYKYMIVYLQSETESHAG